MAGEGARRTAGGAPALQSVCFELAYFTNVNPCGTAEWKTYAYSMTMIPTIAPSAMECQKTKRKMMPSFPTCSVAAVAIVMD